MVAFARAAAKSGSASIIASDRPSSNVIITAFGGGGVPRRRKSASSRAVTKFIPAAARIVASCSRERGDPDNENRPSASVVSPMP